MALSDKKSGFSFDMDEKFKKVTAKPGTEKVNDDTHDYTHTYTHNYEHKNNP